MILSSNVAVGAGGGAIYNVGTLTVTDSTFLNNSAVASGGAIFNTTESTTIDRCLFLLNGANAGGAVALQGGAIAVTNSTFTGNAADFGGAIHLNSGLFDLQNATLDQNAADEEGGAVFLGPGVLAARNTVFSRSRDLANISEALECDGTGGAVVSLGGNLASDGSCQLDAEGDRNDTDPALGELADNGGPTSTILPLPGSPLIDAALAEGCPSVDQRGFPRPADGDEPDGVAACDIGAVEVPEPAAPGLVAFAVLAATARRRAKRIR